jgi:metallo-beta-lactamase family protein
MTWLGHFVTPPDQTFVVHGESSNAAALAEVIQQRLHWQVSVPAQLTSVTF